MITGEIKRFLRDDGMLKVSRSLKEIAYKAYQAKEALTEKLGREPLLEEIAEETGVEKEELVMAMEAAGEVESLHRPVGMKDGNEVMLLEKIADTGGAEEKILDHLLLTELIKELKKDERKLLYLRYFADKTQTEIGEELGISQVQVSRMEKKILKTMRNTQKNKRMYVFWKNRDTISYLKQITKEADAIGKKKKIYLGLCSLCPADSCSDRNDLLL